MIRKVNYEDHGYIWKTASETKREKRGENNINDFKIELFFYY